MEEHALRNIAVLCSVAGLLLLFLASENLELKPKPIKEITSDDIGKTVKVCGEIITKTISNNHVFFTINDSTENIRVVVFNSTAMKLREKGNDIYSFEKGSMICPTGIVDEYPKGSGYLEIIHKKGFLSGD